MCILASSLNSDKGLDPLQQVLSIQKLTLTFAIFKFNVSVQETAVLD